MGLRLECDGSVCGGGREFDNLRVNAPVPVRLILPDGTPADDYAKDPACGDAWSRSTWFNGVPLPKRLVVNCKRRP